MNLPFCYHTHLERFNRGSGQTGVTCSLSLTDSRPWYLYHTQIWDWQCSLEVLRRRADCRLEQCCVVPNKTVGEVLEGRDRLPRICLCRPEENADRKYIDSLYWRIEFHSGCSIYAYSMFNVFYIMRMYNCAQEFGLGLFLSFGLNHFNVYWTFDNAP